MTDQLMYQVTMTAQELHQACEALLDRKDAIRDQRKDTLTDEGLELNLDQERIINELLEELNEVTKPGLSDAAKDVLKEHVLNLIDRWHDDTVHTLGNEAFRGPLSTKFTQTADFARYLVSMLDA